MDSKNFNQDELSKKIQEKIKEETQEKTKAQEQKLAEQVKMLQEQIEKEKSNRNK